MGLATTLLCRVSPLLLSQSLQSPLLRSHRTATFAPRPPVRSNAHHLPHSSDSWAALPRSSSHVSVLLASGIKADGAYSYSSYSGFSALSAGLCCGLAGLAAGIAIGIVGDAGVRANARQPKLFVGIILILIFAEALGLYGLIVALILQSNKLECTDVSDTYYITAPG